MRSLIVGSILVAGVRLQDPQPIPLAGKTERLSLAFTSVDALAELRDGRVVVVDRRERTVWLGDFASGRANAVSRRGSGPLEYLQPQGAFALPDGGVLVSDPANARFLRIDADGRVAGPWRPIGGAGRDATLSNLSAVWDTRAVDSRGGLYFEVLPPPLQSGQSAAVPIIRLDRESARTDTIARYTLTAEMLTMARTPGGRGIAVIRPRAWPARPEWAVQPNGRVAIVDASPYGISFVAGAGRTEGPPVGIQPLRVTEADRNAFTESVQRAPRGPSGTNEPPRPTNAPPPTRKLAGAPLFPDVLPPFSGRESVKTAPDGRIWVTRVGHASDSIRVVDVFDSGGRIVTRIALPPHRRLLALTDACTYLAYRDADDLEYVERVRR